MSFIDNTYFVRGINLTSQQLDNITAYITEYEPEILKKLLGVTLYTELIDDLSEAGVPQTEKFVNLVNGVSSFEFTTISGYDVVTEYKGLKKLIAYYVYYQYRNINESLTTTVGQMLPLAENAQREDVYPKLIYAYNELVKLYGEIPEDYYYRDYFLDNSYYEHYLPDGGAFNYLLANIEDFPGWVFEPIKKKNLFGI